MKKLQTDVLVQDKKYFKQFFTIYNLNPAPEEIYTAMKIIDMILESVKVPIMKMKILNFLKSQITKIRSNFNRYGKDIWKNHLSLKESILYYRKFIQKKHGRSFN